MLGHQWRTRLQAGTASLLSFTHPPSSGSGPAVAMSAEGAGATTQPEQPAYTPPPPKQSYTQHTAPPHTAHAPPTATPLPPPSAPAPPAAAPPPPPPAAPLTPAEEEAERQEYERLSSRFLSTAWGDLGQVQGGGASPGARAGGGAAAQGPLLGAGAPRASAQAAGSGVQGEGCVAGLHDSFE